MTVGHNEINRMKNRHLFREKGRLFLSLLAVIVALTGGASRYDAIQIIPLRVFSMLLLIPAVYYLTPRAIREARVLITLFSLFALFVAFQLVPLPPEIWHSLPERDGIARLDLVLGIDDAWRPLTLAPMRSWNVVGSLIVPAAGLLLAIAFGVTSRGLLQIVAALGVLNAILGLLQILAGPTSALYFYEITNRGSPVGIFANENHAAVFAACSLLVVTILGLRTREFRVSVWERLIYPVAYFLILLTSLVGGSRAGFAAAIGATSVSIAMFVISPRLHKSRSARDPVRRWLDKHPRLVLFAPVLIVLLTAVAFLALDRTPAFKDILSKDSFSDLRWSFWPVIGDMLSTHWVLGSGFGSFEQVYKIYEPSELLMPWYINQAHNDWAQLIIEGGIIAGLLLVGLLVWVVGAIIKVASRSDSKILPLFWVSIFTIVGAASMVDYPLRTPLFQLVMVWLLVALSRDMRGPNAT